MPQTPVESKAQRLLPVHAFRLLFSCARGSRKRCRLLDGLGDVHAEILTLADSRIVVHEQRPAVFDGLDWGRSSSWFLARNGTILSVETRCCNVAGVKSRFWRVGAAVVRQPGSPGQGGQSQGAKVEQRWLRSGWANRGRAMTRRLQVMQLPSESVSLRGLYEGVFLTPGKAPAPASSAPGGVGRPAHPPLRA